MSGRVQRRQAARWDAQQPQQYAQEAPADRAPLDLAYANAMREHSKKYPDDVLKSDKEMAPLEARFVCERCFGPLDPVYDVETLRSLEGPTLLNVRLDLRPDTDPRFAGADSMPRDSTAQSRTDRS